MTPIARKTLSLVHRLRPPASAAPQPAGPPMLVLLHGMGGNELAMAGLASAFDARFLVISLRAPIEIQRFGFAWFHEWFDDAGPHHDPAGVEAAWLELSSFVDEAVAAYEADPRHVFLAGFSQGGIVALAAALTRPQTIAGAVCMSGRLAPEVLRNLAAPELLRDQQILIVHGSDDDRVPVAFGREAAREIEALGVRMTYRELDIGHTTTDGSVALVAAWLDERLTSGGP